MTTTLFDQDPGPYGSCMNCEEVFPDKASMRAHQQLTKNASSDKRSHTAQIFNFPRTERIAIHIEGLVSDALREYGDLHGRELEMNDDVIEEVIEDLLCDINRREDYTVEEALTALDGLREPEIATALRVEVDTNA